MAWQSGYRIIDGEYKDELISIVDTFPYMTDTQPWYLYTVTDTQWVTSHEIYLFNSDREKQVSCQNLINYENVVFSNEQVASIGLYDENHQLIGQLALYLSKVDYYTYQLRGKILNASGVSLFTFYDYYSTCELQRGGVWDSGYLAECYLALAHYTINDSEYIGLYINFGIISNVPYNGDFHRMWWASGCAFNLAWARTELGLDIASLGKEKTRSPEFGPASEPQGGYNENGGGGGGVPQKGTFDFHSDEIPISPKPTLGVTSAGFINVYKIGLNELQDLGEKLFPHFLPAEILDDPSLLSTPEMLAMFLKVLYGALISPAGTSIKLADNLGVIDILMNGKLIDYILDCHVIPTSISGATISPLKIGYRTFSEYQLAKATEDYVDIDCGSLNIKEAFANFLDYNCKVECFLPFIGFVPIEDEYWNNATIQVHYRFNIIDGSFVARLVASRDNDGKECVLNNSVIGQYGGVCCVHFPITGLQYSNVVAGLVNGTAGAVARGASGDVAGVTTSLMNMASLKPEVPSSNGYNASNSFLGQRKPYLVIKYPAPQFSQTYPKEMGLPLNVSYKLSALTGFTVVDNPVLNIACSDEEYNEICNALKAGVIL